MKGAARLVVIQEQAEIVRRIFRPLRALRPARLRCPVGCTGKEAVLQLAAGGHDPGRKNVPSYIRAGHREKGKTFCANQTGVPMAALNRAVIDALRVTFSDVKFEQSLRDQAADAGRSRPGAPSGRTCSLQIPKLAAVEAESRLADLEGYEPDLRDRQEQVERLRRVWGGWAAALEADVPTARHILKKILVGRILVRPVGPAPGASPGSRVTMAPSGDVRPGSGPRYDDFCWLMLHLLAEPEGLAESKGMAGAPDRSRRESLYGLCAESKPTRVIAGGCEEGDWGHSGRVSSGPPWTTWPVNTRS